MKKPGKKQTYTLVELLVVVALAAILFGIGLPAFNTLTRGNAMTASINEVAGKIKATRAYAVSNACYTALLFPDTSDEGWSSSSSADSKLRMAITNRACRPCVVVPRNNENEWIFDSWIDGEDWLMLGKSVIVSLYLNDPEDDDDNKNFFRGFAYWSKVPSQSELTNLGDITPPRAPADCTYSVDVPRSYLVEGGNSDKVTFLRAILFRPNGQLVENVVLTLQEGAVIPGSSSPKVIPTRAMSDRVYYALGVNKFNGKIIYYTPIPRPENP